MRDTLLGHLACLLNELGETPATQATRPPQPNCGGGRRLDVVIAKCQCCAADTALNLCLEARRPLALPSAHRVHQRPGGRAEPLPQRPHPVPSAPDVLIFMGHHGTQPDHPHIIGVPRQHRTDHLGAAIHPLSADGRVQAKERYRLLMAHYHLEPTTNNLGVAHENGDVEQEHFRFKDAVDQALRVRGSRDFANRGAYDRFLQQLVGQRNLTRQARWAEERQALRPLPLTPLLACREVRVPVSRFSTIRVLQNTYSVPSRLIGTTLLVRVRSETLEVYRATAHLLSMPRLLGTGQHSIDYRHVIWSLVRKPGAFAHYRYRDDLFPSLTFRRAYDALQGQAPERADRHYVRLLHLAASTSESEIETALGLLLEQHVVPTFDVVRDLTRPPSAQRVPQLSQPRLDLSVYDRLLSQEAARA